MSGSYSNTVVVRATEVDVKEREIREDVDGMTSAVSRDVFQIASWHNCYGGRIHCLYQDMRDHRRIDRSGEHRRPIWLESACQVNTPKPFPGMFRAHVSEYP